MKPILRYVHFAVWLAFRFFVMILFQRFYKIHRLVALKSI